MLSVESQLPLPVQRFCCLPPVVLFLQALFDAIMLLAMVPRVCVVICRGSQYAILVDEDIECQPGDSADVYSKTKNGGNKGVKFRNRNDLRRQASTSKAARHAA